MTDAVPPSASSAAPGSASDGSSDTTSGGAPPRLDGVDQVVAEPLRFKARLAIGENAYQSLRMINRTRELWDVLGAAGAGAAVAKTGMAASLLGASATPIGWVAFAALASGGACYGLYRLLGNTRGSRVIEIPKYLNTPLDTLGLAIFDLIAPLSLRLAAVDGDIDAAERAHLVRHLVEDWGLHRGFVEQAVAAIEPGAADGELDQMAREGAEFLHANPDCNHAAIVTDLSAFFRDLLLAGGPLDAAEEAALTQVSGLLSVTPPGELAKAWAQARTVAGGAADWTQERLPRLDDVRRQAGAATAQAVEAARQAADWTQERLPSAAQVRTSTAEAAALAAEAARRAAGWAQERLPDAERVGRQTVQAADQLGRQTAKAAGQVATQVAGKVVGTAGVVGAQTAQVAGQVAGQTLDTARKGLAWVREQAGKAADATRRDADRKPGKPDGDTD